MAHTAVAATATTAGMTRSATTGSNRRAARSLSTSSIASATRSRSRLIWAERPRARHIGQGPGQLGVDPGLGPDRLLLDLRLLGLHTLNSLPCGPDVGCHVRDDHHNQSGLPVVEFLTQYLQVTSTHRPGHFDSLERRHDQRGR